MTANKWYCIAQSSTFDSSCGITIYSEGVAVSFTASVRFGSSSINIASCAIDGDILLSVRLRETDNKWCIDLLCNTEFNPTIDITDSPYWEVQNTPAGTGSILAIINDISKEFNTGVKGGESLWQLYNFGTQEKPEYAVVPKDYDGKPIGVVSKTFISFGGHNSGAGEGTGGGGITSFNVVLNDKKYTSEGDTLTITEKLTPLNSFNTLNGKVSEMEKVLNEIKNLWFIDPDNADTIRTVYNVVVEKAISFGGYGESSGTGGGITTFDVYIGNDGPYSLVNGRVDLPAYPTADLTGYATENWVKEQGYLTQHQDISHLLGKDEAKDIYATIIALNEVSDRVETIESIIGIDSKGNVYIKKKADGTARNFYTYGAISFGGNGESSGGGEVIGSSVQYNASVTSGKLLGTLVIDGVDNKIYAPAIPTKLSAFTNDVDFAKVSDIPSLEDYATRDWVEQQNYLTSIPLKYVTETELANKGFATQDWVNDQGFLTSHQSLTHLLSKTEAANTYQPKGNYVTESALNGKGYLTQSDAEDTYQPKGDYAVLDDLNSYLLASTAKNTYATIQALNAATIRIETLESTLETEQGYIDTLQGYFTSGKANKAIADGNGNNIVDTYATKVALNSTNTNLTALSKEFSEFKELINSLWYLDPDHADTVRTKLNVVVEQAISFGGYGESSGSGGGITTVTYDMVIQALGFTPYNSSNPKGYITSSALSSYATQNWVTENYQPKGDYLTSTTGVTLSTSQTITGIKTFSNGLKIGSTAIAEKTKNSTKYLEIDGNLVVTGAISFGGFGEGGSTGGGIASVTKDMVIDALGYTPYNATNPNGYITSSALNGYATTSWVNSGFYSAEMSRTANTVLAAPNGYDGSATFRKLASADIPSLDWSKITSGKPTTLSGYGITDAIKTSGGTITGSYGALIIKRDGTNASLVKFTNTNSTLGMLGFLNTNEPVAYLGSDISSGKVLLHAGNYTDYALAKDSAEYVRFSSRIYEGDYKHIGYGYAAQLDYTGPAMSFGASSSYYAQILATSGDLYFRQYYNGSWYNDGWQQLAFTTSNVASATKLKTARSIWGQSFDGSKDVTGSLFYVLNINPDTAHNYSCGASDKPWNVVYTRYLDTYSGYDLRFRTGGTEQMRLAAASGCLILGGSSASESSAYKLDVRGVVRAINSSDGSGVVIANQGNTIDGYYNGWGNLYLNYASSGNVNLVVGGGNVGIGTTNPSSKLHIAGDVTLSDTTGSASKSYKLKFLRRTDTDDYWDYGIYAQSTKGLTFYQSSEGINTDIAYLTGEGNFVVNGSITFGSASDRRLKDNIKSMTDKQAVAVLSALNPVTFNWNSTAYELGKLSGVSDGFIADEYEKIIPNSGRDIWANYRAINYERATGYLVKGWQNHETRIERLERENKELKEQLKQYRRA